jgi:hypothetical protein
MEEQHKSTATKKRKVYYARVDEGRKRVIGIIAGIIMARNLDLFGGKSKMNLITQRSVVQIHRPQPTLFP